MDNDLNQLISNGTKKIFYKKNDYFLVGKIKLLFKKNIDIKLSITQITGKIPKNTKCKDIEKLKLNKDILIKDFNDLDIKNINDLIINNLSKINDFVKINKNDYLILCKINFNKKKLNDLNYSLNIENLVNEIESEFIKTKLKEYNYVKNN